jgi:hypothetical protein
MRGGGCKKPEYVNDPIIKSFLDQATQIPIGIFQFLRTVTSFWNNVRDVKYFFLKFVTKFYLASEKIMKIDWPIVVLIKIILFKSLNLYKNKKKAQFYETYTFKINQLVF